MKLQLNFLDIGLIPLSEFQTRVLKIFRRIFVTLSSGVAREPLGLERKLMIMNLNFRPLSTSCLLSMWEVTSKFMRFYIQPMWKVQKAVREGAPKPELKPTLLLSDSPNLIHTAHSLFHWLNTRALHRLFGQNGSQFAMALVDKVRTNTLQCTSSVLISGLQLQLNSEASRSTPILSQSLQLWPTIICLR